MAKRLKIQTPSGMHDVLPKDQPYMQKITSVVDKVAHFYGFGKIDVPIVEDVVLYEKGTGQDTEIVEKQMYTLKTKGGSLLALRPEFTPGIVRSYIQHGMHNLSQPVKLYTHGPLFRYEHPQAGRFRQFRQFDFEVLGDDSPATDAQLIQIFYVILQELKLGHLIIEINSIGDSKCRPYYKKLLSSFFRARQNSLCADCKRRLKQNPLRILDCKEEKCQRVKSQAPQFIDHLCDDCKKHFKSVLEFLDEADLPYHLDPYLVRGLDYYTKTVFEITSERDESKQALLGGGRYDTLVKLLGGKETAASGGAAGIERIIALMKDSGIEPQVNTPRVFLAQLGDFPKKKSLKLLEEFRKAGILVAESLGKDSLGSQLSRANKLGVQYSLILGQREALNNSIVIRTMETGKQQTVKVEDVIKEIKKKLKK